MVIDIEDQPQETMFLVALPPEMSPVMRPGTYLVTSAEKTREEINATLTEARQENASIEFTNCWIAVLNVQMAQHPQQPGQVQIMHACHMVPFTMHDTTPGSNWVLCPQMWIFPSEDLRRKLQGDRDRAARELGLQKSGLVQAPANALNNLRQPQ